MEREGFLRKTSSEVKAPTATVGTRGSEGSLVWGSGLWGGGGGSANVGICTNIYAVVILVVFPRAIRTIYFLDFYLFVSTWIGNGFVSHGTD